MLASVMASEPGSAVDDERRPTLQKDTIYQWEDLRKGVYVGIQYDAAVALRGSLATIADVNPGLIYEYDLIWVESRGFICVEIPQVSIPSPAIRRIVFFVHLIECSATL